MSEQTTQIDPELCYDLAQAKVGQKVIQRRNATYGSGAHIATIVKVWASGVIVVEGLGGNTLYNPDGLRRGNNSRWDTSQIVPFRSGETVATILERNQEAADLKAAVAAQRKAEKDARFREIIALNPSLIQDTRVVALAPQVVTWTSFWTARGQYSLFFTEAKSTDGWRIKGWLVGKNHSEEVEASGDTYTDALLRLIDRILGKPGGSPWATRYRRVAERNRP